MYNSAWAEKKSGERIIALVGNPNVGKSTLFNALTGSKQHTGNWPGKTVEVAYGTYVYKGRTYVLVDLPGTYSLHTHSLEEQEAVDFLKGESIDCVVFVGDATCLERSLCFALQVMQITRKFVFCLNLIDEAERKHIDIDLTVLERGLGVPLVGTAASSKCGIDTLKETIRKTSDGFSVSAPTVVTADQTEKTAAKIFKTAIHNTRIPYEPCDRMILGKWTGYLMVFLLLMLVFYLTISGANHISEILEFYFQIIGDYLCRIMCDLPVWLGSLLLQGIYDTVSCVMSVMIPPIIIFYPLFSFLEELGYLPRVAFLMDHSFSKCGGCGKQALTTMMGFGCNTVGVMGCRIISSPKERLIAILTNSLVPCNGRFPAIIILATIICSGYSVMTTILLCGFLSVSIGATLFTSWILNRFLPKEEKTCFYLELPPYRLPRIRNILTRTLFDKIGYIIGRTAIVSVPIGIVIWCLQNISVSDKALLYYISDFLDPIGHIMGMNGVIFLAFILSFPANELLLPLIAASVRNAPYVVADRGMLEVLQQSGVTWSVAVCMLFFTLFHWPCVTTCMTIRKETKSWKWTMLAMLLPTIIGIVGCIILSFLLNGLVIL